MEATESNTKHLDELLLKLRETEISYEAISENEVHLTFNGCKTAPEYLQLLKGLGVRARIEIKNELSNKDEYRAKKDLQMISDQFVDAIKRTDDIALLANRPTNREKEILSSWDKMIKSDHILAEYNIKLTLPDPSINTPSFRPSFQAIVLGFFGNQRKFLKDFSGDFEKFCNLYWEITEEDKSENGTTSEREIVDPDLIEESEEDKDYWERIAEGLRYTDWRLIKHCKTNEEIPYEQVTTEVKEVLEPRDYSDGKVNDTPTKEASYEKEFSNLPSFKNYLNETGVKVLPFLCGTYTNAKPDVIGFTLFALKDLKLIDESAFSNKTALHKALKNDLGEIGTRQQLGNNITTLSFVKNKAHISIAQHREAIKLALIEVLKEEKLPFSC